MSGHLVNAQDFIQKRAIRNFGQADPEYGRQLSEAIERLKAGVSKQISQ